MSGTDYPVGDGNPGCTDCKGRGVVSVPPEEQHGLTTTTRICSCVIMRDVLYNVERGWKGLAKAKPIPESPLKGRTDESLWVTTSDVAFREHLRHVAVRMGPYWRFTVVSDADLMDAWLSGANEVLDPDVATMRGGRPSARYGGLADLTEPPELLIIRTGIKAARNVAMPEVLLEAIMHREHLDKATWVIDKPSYKLGENHISWDHHVGDAMCLWPHIELEGSGEELTVTPAFSNPAATRPSPMTMSGSNPVFEDDTEFDPNAVLREERNKAREKANKSRKGGKR